MPLSSAHRISPAPLPTPPTHALTPPPPPPSGAGPVVAGDRLSVRHQLSASRFISAYSATPPAAQDPWSLGDVPLPVEEYADLVGLDEANRRTGDPVHDLQVNGQMNNGQIQEMVKRINGQIRVHGQKKLNRRIDTGLFSRSDAGGGGRLACPLRARE